MITLAVIVAVAAIAGIYVTRKADCACGVCRIAFLLRRSRQPRQTVAEIQDISPRRAPYAADVARFTAQKESTQQ